MDDEDLAFEMMQQNGLKTTSVNELGDKIHYTVQRSVNNATVRVLVEGPTSTCRSWTWTCEEFHVLAGLFATYSRFIQKDEEGPSEDSDEMPALVAET